MALIECIPPFPHLLFEKETHQGIALDVLVVRGTFDLGADGDPMQLAAEQTPLTWGDTLAGPAATNPLATVLEDDGDLVIGKPGTDIILSGHIRSPYRHPLKDWIAGIRVGDVSKSLRVTGPRRFERSFLGWGITPPEPVARVPLDYRLSFGGHIDLPSADGPATAKYAQNPAGVGWLPSASDMKGLTRTQKRSIKAWEQSLRVLIAPQFEDHTKPITHPSDRPTPEGFGPIARWWQPRIAYQGTLDSQWLAERYPNWPDDYNPRYAQSARPDLVTAQHLCGDEPIILSQCLVEPRVDTRLPGLCVQASVHFANGEHSLTTLVLDTLRINLNTRQCTLAWRTAFNRNNPPVEITIIATALGQTQVHIRSHGSYLAQAGANA